MAQYHGFLVGLKWFVCTDVGPPPPILVYLEQAVSLVHFWIYILGIQDRNFLFFLNRFISEWVFIHLRASRFGSHFWAPHSEVYQVFCTLTFLGWHHLACPTTLKPSQKPKETEQRTCCNSDWSFLSALGITKRSYPKTGELPVSEWRQAEFWQLREEKLLWN